MRRAPPLAFYASRKQYSPVELSAPFSKTTALIVGAGIGGLAAGVALRRSGFEVRLFERSTHPRELGFALLLAPNAMSALRELGLAERIWKGGVVAAKGEIRRPNGDVLRRLDASVVREKLGEDSVCILRPVLHGALLDAIDSSDLQLSSEAVGFRALDGGVELSLADGSSVSGRVLIGADGVGSCIRRSLHPEEPPPRPSGLFALRGVARDVAHHLGELSGAQYLGSGIEAGVARAGEREVYWYLSLRAEDVGSGPVDPSNLLERSTRCFHDTFRTMVLATEPDDLRLDELFEREPLEQWGASAVTLLGDAAHPMLPHAGQGAAQSLEDAVVLGRALHSAAVPEDGLRCYERLRGDRTKAVIALARRNARVGSVHGAIACWFRDLAIRLVPESVILKSLVALGRPPQQPLSGPRKPEM